MSGCKIGRSGRENGLEEQWMEYGCLVLWVFGEGVKGVLDCCFCCFWLLGGNGGLDWLNLA